MKRRIYLHFGAHKTGSSSIQDSLSNLSNDDWHFLKAFKGANQSGPVTYGFYSNPQAILKQRFRPELSPELIRKSYQKQVQENRSKQFILSAESLDWFEPTDLVNIRDFFSGQDLDVFFIGYLRPLVDCTRSRLQQQLKGSPNLALKAKNLNQLLKRCFPDYSGLVQRLRVCVSPEQIRLLAFDPVSFPDHNVVKDFCNRLGIKDPGIKIHRSNESLSLLAVKLLWIGSKLKHSIPSSLDVRIRKAMAEQLRNDFKDTTPFRIQEKILLSAVRNESIKYNWIDPLIESDRSFSLCGLSSLALHNNDFAVTNLRELEILTADEEQLVSDAISSRGSSNLDGAQATLVESYWKSIPV